MKRVVMAVVLALTGTPGLAASTSDSFNVVITSPGAPPPPGVAPAPASSDLCVSQTLSGASGGLVSVICRSGQFVSIEPQSGARFLGAHGGAFRYYFANGIPESLRYLGGPDPWVGPGTVTSIRINYLEGLDQAVEIQVGF